MNDEVTAEARTLMKAVSDRILKILYATDDRWRHAYRRRGIGAAGRRMEDAAPALPVADATVAVEAPIE